MSSKYLCWFSSGDYKHFQNFRFEELESLSALFSASTSRPFYAEPRSQNPDCPYALIHADSETKARLLAKRSVLLFGVFECWADADSVEDLLSQVEKLAASSWADRHFKESVAFCGRVKSYGKKISSSDKTEMLKRVLEKLPLKGPVRLEQPDVEFWLFLDFGQSMKGQTQTLKRAFFGRKISFSAREELLSKFALNARAFIGTTSTKAELAFLMANQVLAKPGGMYYDPFVGTGSLIVSCAAVGGSVYGSDIDIRVLWREKDQNSTIQDNFRQYKLPRPELLRMDSSMPVWRKNMVFDGIVCDPPYGIREGARKSGTQKKIKEIPLEYRDSHIPRTQLYDVSELMDDLLSFSAAHLKLGGRLAYLLPTSHEYKEEDLPAHPNLKLIANSEQYLSFKLRRRLITMVKTSEPTEESENAWRNRNRESQPSHARVKLLFNKDYGKSKPDSQRQISTDPPE